MRLWVTRSQPGAERTAEALRTKGHEAVVQPVLEAQRNEGRFVLMQRKNLVAAGHLCDPGNYDPVFRALVMHLQ